MSELQYKLFEFLEKACIDEGGDGEVGFFSPYWKEEASSFEDWLKESNNSWWGKDSKEDRIYFYNEQEYIFFAPYDASFKATTSVKTMMKF